MLTSPQTRQRVAEWIDTYTFLEEAALEDVTESTAMITLLGPQALDVLRQVTGSRVPSLEPYFSTAVSINGIHAKLLRTDPTGAPGYSLVMASEEAEGVWSAVASPATAAVLVGDDTFNVLRLEAGLPRYGWELSEDVNPWEVDLGRFIHFDKGCYTGQEVVLRLNTYNKVQRQLVRLNFSSSGVCVGAKLTYGGDEVGTVTSVAAHPVTGEHIGLGLVHRPIAKAGADLEVIGEGSHPSSTARVMDIPSRTPVPA
jgi:folate-binding protein YgfZ